MPERTSCEMGSHHPRNSSSSELVTVGKKELVILGKKELVILGKKELVILASPAAKKRCIGHGVASEFKLRKTRKSLGGAVEPFTVKMKEVKHLYKLKKAIATAIAKNIVHTSSSLYLVLFSTRQLIRLLLHSHQWYWHRKWLPYMQMLFHRPTM